MDRALSESHYVTLELQDLAKVPGFAGALVRSFTEQPVKLSIAFDKYCDRIGVSPGVKQLIDSETGEVIGYRPIIKVKLDNSLRMDPGVRDPFEDHIFTFEKAVRHSVKELVYLVESRTET